MISPSSNSTIMRKDILFSHNNTYNSNVEKFIKEPPKETSKKSTSKTLEVAEEMMTGPDADS